MKPMPTSKEVELGAPIRPDVDERKDAITQSEIQRVDVPDRLPPEGFDAPPPDWESRVDIHTRFPLAKYILLSGVSVKPRKPCDWFRAWLRPFHPHLRGDESEDGYRGGTIRRGRLFVWHDNNDV